MSLYQDVWLVSSKMTLILSGMGRKRDSRAEQDSFKPAMLTPAALALKQPNTWLYDTDTEYLPVKSCPK